LVPVSLAQLVGTNAFYM